MNMPILVNKPHYFTVVKSMHYLNSKSKPKYRIFSLILLGFLLFGLKEFAKLVYLPLQSFMAVAGLLLIFATPLFFTFKRVIPLKGSVKIIFYAYLLWIVLIVMRPLFLGQGYTDNSIHPYANFGLSSYLLPLIVLLGSNVISLPKLFKIIFLFSIIGYVFFVVNFNTMQSIVLAGETATIDGEMGLGDLANSYYFWFSISSFSLLCYEFVSIKYKRFAILTCIFTLFLMTYFARRGGIFMYSMYFLGMYYLYLEQAKTGNRFFKILLLAVLIYIVYEFVVNYSGSTFEILFDRIEDDTRSSVDEFLIKYLDKENAWWFGNGIEAAYKHPDFSQPRYVHETGYLYLIMKGGILNLFFYLYLLLHAFYLGFFKTNNRLTKGLALYMLFHIIFLLPFGVPNFSLEYLFVWIAFALCESSNYRSMSNEQIKQYLSKN